MSGTLPKEIVWRTERGEQAVNWAEIFDYYRSQLNRDLEAISQTKSSRIIDVKRIENKVLE